jgi:hypothetical protein
MAKKLLNEATVRRFQSLANLKPINEMRSSIEEEQVEETIEENVYEADEAPEAPEMMGAEEAPEDLEAEMGAPEGGVMELTQEEAELLAKLGEMAAAELEGMDSEAAPEDEMAPDPVGEPEEMSADPMGDEEMMEALSGINYVPSQTEIVNEVARRVARRLAKAQKAEKLMKEALGRK